MVGGGNEGLPLGWNRAGWMWGRGGERGGRDHPVCLSIRSGEAGVRWEVHAGCADLEMLRRRDLSVVSLGRGGLARAPTAVGKGVPSDGRRSVSPAPLWRRGRLCAVSCALTTLTVGSHLTDHSGVRWSQ